MEILLELSISAAKIAEEIRRDVAKPVTVSFVKEEGITRKVITTLKGSSAGIFGGLCVLTENYLKTECENREEQKELLNLIHEVVSESLEED